MSYKGDALEGKIHLPLSDMPISLYLHQAVVVKDPSDNENTLTLLVIGGLQSPVHPVSSNEVYSLKFEFFAEFAKLKEEEQAQKLAT